jgi:hypothetical protein
MARGPAYPYVDLEQAVDFARKMFQYTRRSPAEANAVIKEAWNYSPTSSSSGKLVAAMKYFGLIEEPGGSEGRLIRLTDRAYRILVDDANSPERRQALHDAVLSPKAYLLCWTKWGAELPLSMRSNLIFGEGFIESTVDGFINDYKKSIEYAGLLNDHTSSTGEEPAVREAPAAPTSTRIEPELPSTQVPFVAASHNLSPDLRSDVFSLSEGTVSLSWPKNLSEESFQDLSDWLDLLKRKIERTVIRN